MKNVKKTDSNFVNSAKVGAYGECQGQQERGSRAETLLPDCVVAEPQPEYGAELFEKYQREHGEDMVQAAGQTVTQEVEKSR